ncbi:MAG: 50S ribosomal protein L4 [Patescibacteria group bacterium]|jgi:large subunit ribosomal protein L4
MKKIKLYNLEGTSTGEITLPKFFETEVNPSIIHEVVVAERANQRVAIAHTKTRGNVAGGGKKPWRQKGTGRARAGSSRSPLWRSGGITFGPLSDRNYAKKINRKVKKLALAMAYSDKVSSMAVIDKMSFENIKTKIASALLSKLPFENGKVLIAGTKKDENFKLVFRNIAGIQVEEVNSVSVLDLMKNKNLIISRDAIKELEINFKQKIKEEAEETEKTSEIQPVDEKKPASSVKTEVEAEKVIESKEKAVKKTIKK